MKRRFIVVLAALLLLGASVVAQDPPIRTELGGLRRVIDATASLDIASGGELDMESGSVWKIAGVTVTASAADLNNAGAAASNLDSTYDFGGAGAGRTIDVDSGPVELTTSDTDNNVVLAIVQNDSTNDNTALTIASAADAANAISIDIDSQTTGRDIEGTGANWHVTGAGVATLVDVQTTTATVSGAFTASTNITLANGGLITNDTNNEIEFEENSEEFSFAFTSNTITFATDTGIDTLGLGDVDAMTGVGSIAFDADPASISLAADGAADDLTIQVTGAQNASLVFASAGTSADAMTFTTTAGGMDLVNGGAAGGEDTDISATNASVNITAGESAADSVVITSSIGGIQILAAGAAAGEDIVFTATGSSITATATEADAAAISLQASAGGIDIDAVDDINIAVASSAGADDFRIIQTGAFDASISLEAAGTGNDAIRLQASAGGIDIDALDDLNIAVASTAGGDDLVIAQTGANDSSVLVQAAGTGTDAVSLQASAGGVDIDAVDDVVITVASTGAADDLSLVQTGAVDASILLTAAGTGTDAIGLTASAGSITLAAPSGDVNITPDLDLAGAITGDGGDTIDGMLRTVIVDSDGLTLTIAQSGAIVYATGAGVINLPEGSTANGMWYTIVVGATANIDVNPDNGDQILLLTNAAGDAIRADAIGESVTLICVTDTNWVVWGAEKGTWDDVD
jgi:hypothetical protein